MRSLLLLAVSIAAIEALMVQVQNRCDTSHYLNEVDPKNGTVTPLFLVEKRTTSCFHKYKGTHLYAFGFPRQAKATFEITVSSKGTTYSIDSSNGLDFPMKIVPIGENSIVSGHIIKCDKMFCPNEEYKSDIDAIFVSFCSGRKASVDLNCRNQRRHNLDDEEDD